MSSSSTPLPHDPQPVPRTSCMMEQEVELPKPACMTADTIKSSLPSPQLEYGNGARAVHTIDVVDFGQHDAEYGKPSCMMSQELPKPMMVEELPQPVMTDKPSCMMDNGSDTLPNNDQTSKDVMSNDVMCSDSDTHKPNVQGEENDQSSCIGMGCDDVIGLRGDVVMSSCSVNDRPTSNGHVIRASCMQGPTHPYFTPRPPILRPACAYTIPNIINLNQSSPKPNEDDFQNFKTEPRNPESYMYPQPPFGFPPHPVFNPFNPHPSVIRPTVFKPDSIQHMFNSRMFYPGYMRYPGMPVYPPFPNMYTHHMFPPRLQKPPPVISVPSDEEEKEVDVENTDPVEDLAAELVKVKKVKPIGKVKRRPKVADQKCSKCDGHFLRGPELFCHIEKVHKKNKDHACRHCVYTLPDKKRSRNVSISSSTSTTSAIDSPPQGVEESSQERGGSVTGSQELCPSTPTNGTLKIRTETKTRAKKQKGEPDLSLPSPKTLQNSFNKIF